MNNIRSKLTISFYIVKVVWTNGCKVYSIINSAVKLNTIYKFIKKVEKMSKEENDIELNWFFYIVVEQLF